MKVSAMIKAFMSGTKALYGDMRKSFDLRVEKGGLKVSTAAPTKDFPFSREQLQLIYKVSISGSCTVVHVCACLFGPTIYQISRFKCARTECAMLCECAK